MATTTTERDSKGRFISDDDRGLPNFKVLAGAAIGSAAVAAALLYVSKRKAKNKPTQPGPIPSGEAPETD